MTADNGMVFFGLGQTNLQILTVHWMQYSQSISRETTLDDIEEKSVIKEKIDSARMKAAICQYIYDESDSLIKSADPGNTNKKKGWV